MGNIAKIEEQQQANVPALSSESQAVLSMIERVVLNPEADMDKLDKMLDMQERILNRNAKQAYTADLAAMQAELPLVAKRGTGHNNAKFAKLEDINEAIRPTLQKYGFAVTFRVKQNDARLLVVAILSHRDGHSEETELVLPLDTSGNKNGVQAIGSTVSYGKRYALCALLNISTGDDTDGDGLGDSRLFDATLDLMEADNLQALQAKFGSYWKTFTGSKDRQKLTAAKDKRKKELSNA